MILIPVEADIKAFLGRRPLIDVFIYVPWGYYRISTLFVE